MRVRVTGTRGFIGRHLVQMLGQEPLETAELVIHAGACVGRERCDSDPDYAVSSNVTSTQALAKTCVERGTSLLYISTAEVENPRNLYALTKRWGEEACRLYLPPEHLSIARLGAQYGPGARRDTLTNFLQAAMEGRELLVYRDVWRTWTYVEDTARALVLIAEAALRWRDHGTHSSVPAIYNVDSGDRHELIEVAAKVVDLVGGQVTEVAAPAGYATLPLPDTSRLRALGWNPQVSFDEGLARTYAHLSVLV